MSRTTINPWNWQEPLGFVHANKLDKPQSIIFLAGQTATDEKGRTLCEGNMLGQITQTLDNISCILQQAGMDFSHVLRLNIYTVDLPALMAVHDGMVKELQLRGCQHAGTLLGISALAGPGALVEIEVTAGY
jgi:enamine deaminase RidA (YjgF/YER057c/UK114 family)